MSPAEHIPGMAPDDGPESLGRIIPRVLRMRGIETPIPRDDERTGPPRTASAWNETGATSRMSVRVLTPVA